MRKIISLICLLLPIAVYAEELRLQDNAPDHYLVQKGDTLWDISAKFFKDPWKWPQIWGYNKDTIKDPHWIYPGNTVYLDRNTHTLRVVEEGATAPGVNGESATGHGTPEVGAANASDETPDFESTTSSIAGATKLKPHPRVLPGRTDAISVLSIKDIGSFLARPLVIDDDELDNAPTLVGSYEYRKLLGTGDVAYVENLPADKGERWQIYREDRTFVDPDTGEMLGHEVFYLGDASVEKFGEISTLNITKAVREIQAGDHLAQALTGFSSNYMPHAPSKEVNAKIIAVYGGVQQAGQNSVVTINKGGRDGLENGHVLAIYQKGEELHNGNIFKKNIVLPDVRYGLLFIFRVFNKVSYGLVMETRLPVEIGDRASNPE